MSYTRASKAPDSTSVAVFKVWAQWMADTIVAQGWVRTGDTGQVNWGGLGAVPSAVGTYEVYAMNDSLQATMPIVMRIDYYAATNAPRIAVAIGTGSDGTGNVTGQFCQGASLPAAATADTTARDCIICGSTSSLALHMFRDSSNNLHQFAIVVDRYRDSTGAQVDTYAQAWLLANSSHVWTGLAPKAGTGIVAQWSLDFAICSLTNPVNANWSFQGNVAMSPVFMTPGFLGNPTLMMVMCRAADCTEAEQKTVSIYGANHNYLFTKTASAQAWNKISGQTVGVGLLME
jgi:hypothetical protein